jgi:hypothetical protein
LVYEIITNDSETGFFSNGPQLIMASLIQNCPWQKKQNFELYFSRLVHFLMVVFVRKKDICIYLNIQWGSEYCTYKYKTHLNTGRLHVRFSNTFHHPISGQILRFSKALTTILFLSIPKADRITLLPTKLDRFIEKNNILITFYV